jgi:drug/metabolite transporter (DMT)-like permease
MLVCCTFAVDTTGDSDKKGGIKWFLLCILALIASAGIGLMQKVHQTSEYKGELMGFLIISFCTGAVISALAYLLLHRKETALCGKPERKPLLPIVALVATCGIGVAVNHSFNLFLSGAMDTSIFFPVINGLPLLASLIVSFVIFKEKLKKKQLFGFAIGIVALVCLFV